MDRNAIIDGLKMTRDLCVFDPSTGEEIEPHLLNDINSATYDACKGALEILERLDTDSDIISRQAAIEAVAEAMRGLPVVCIDIAEEAIKQLPPAQPERIVHCKDCEWWTKQECSPQGRCALSGMYPTGGWFCGNARMREVTT